MGREKPARSAAAKTPRRGPAECRCSEAREAARPNWRPSTRKPPRRAWNWRTRAGRDALGAGGKAGCDAGMAKPDGASSGWKSSSPSLASAARRWSYSRTRVVRSAPARGRSGGRRAPAGVGEVHDPGAHGRGGLRVHGPRGAMLSPGQEIAKVGRVDQVGCGCTSTSGTGSRGLGMRSRLPGTPCRTAGGKAPSSACRPK